MPLYSNNKNEEFHKLTNEILNNLRHIKGYPLGKDDDIIKMSVPPNYVVGPNPWLKEFIEEKLDKLDKPGAGNEIRQYLEYIFSEACQKFSVKIPFRKNGKYMLNDYFENFRTRISEIKLNSNSQWKNDVLRIYNDLDMYRPIINSLSHYNDNSPNFSIDEINDVFIKSKELEKILSCTNCETILEYDHSSKLIKCINQKCKVKTIYQ